MRATDLQRDDSVLPVTVFISLIVHALLILLLVIPPNSSAMPKEHIIDVTYQKLPNTDYFKNFSQTDRIYATATQGVTKPVTGTDHVEPDRLKIDRSELLKEIGPATDNPIEVVEDRKIYGEASTTAQATAKTPPTKRRIASLAMDHPLTPSGIIADQDRQQISRLNAKIDDAASPSSTGNIRQTDDNPSNISSSDRPGNPSPGLSAPGHAALKAYTPQYGIEEFRPTTTMTSVGENVAQNISEVAKPDGKTAPLPNSKTFGKRRVLYQPSPDYPPWAVRDNVQATVTFFLTISPEGHVSRARLAISSTYPELDRLAEESVRRWLYEPRPGQSEELNAAVSFVLRNQL
ncbi:MAG: TonB family protein [Candidatus Lindowbacteria bacterium]|nr:TonB family protein [Candidatus Lindowbacteria bacterium]